VSAVATPASARRTTVTVDQYIELLPDEDHPAFDQSCAGYVICSHRELGVFHYSKRDAARALALSRGLVLADDAVSAGAVSRKLRWLEWSGSALGILGASALATNTPISRYGWIAFLAANFAMIGFARGINARGLLLQQVAFTATSILGLVRSFGLGL